MRSNSYSIAPIFVENIGSFSKLKIIELDQRFLKQVGVTSQREIEHIVMKAIETGKLNGNETFDVKMTLEAPSIGLSHCIEGKIAME